MREGMFSRITVYPRETVGIDRSAAQAFLGYPQGAHSMRISHAEARVTGAGPKMTSELVIKGVVTVFDGFAAYNELVRIQVGDHALEFQPDKHGVAEKNQATFRVKNANEFGVIRGGLMEFELVLAGAEWAAVANTSARATAESISRHASGPGHNRETETMFTLSLDVARAHHVATATITPQR